MNLTDDTGHVRLIRGTVMDAVIVDGLVCSSDVVFDLAAAVGVTRIVRDPLGTVHTNVRGTESMLASAPREPRCGGCADWGRARVQHRRRRSGQRE